MLFVWGWFAIGRRRQPHVPWVVREQALERLLVRHTSSSPTVTRSESKINRGSRMGV
jgi:hypothetical protein